MLLVCVVSVYMYSVIYSIVKPQINDQKIIYTFLHRATHSVLSHRKISECVCDITDKFTFINAFNLTRPYSNTRRQVKNQIEMIWNFSNLLF